MLALVHAELIYIEVLTERQASNVKIAEDCMKSVAEIK